MFISKRSQYSPQLLSSRPINSEKKTVITTVDQARDYINVCGVRNKRHATHFRHQLETMPSTEKFSADSRTLVLAALDELKDNLPDTLELGGENESPLSETFLKEMKFILNKKRDIQSVAQSYVNDRDRSGNAKATALQKSTLTQAVLEDSVAQHFNTGAPVYVRTLRFTHDKEALEGYGASGKTPAKRELDTLRNSITGIDVVMTPSSILQADVKARTISQMEEPHRPKWKGLPSAIYMPQKTPDSVRPVFHERPGFGDVHSFASNKGFDEEYSKLSPSLSHAEKLKLIESKLWVHTKPDPARRHANFLHSIEDMVNEMKTLQAHKPSSELRHNEFCARLEAWDARALEIGESVPVAIASLIEFNIEMHALAKTLEHDGINFETLNGFLERQMSWGTGNVYHDVKNTNDKMATLDKREKERLLTDICQKLRQGVSLCTYEFNDYGSSIRALSLKEFSFEDIQSGIEKFLATKLVHLP